MKSNDIELNGDTDNIMIIIKEKALCEASSNSEVVCISLCVNTLGEIIGLTGLSSLGRVTAIMKTEYFQQ